MAKTPCPKSFIQAGAASVVLRHALFDVDQHFKKLSDSLEAAHADMKANDMARMELAPGEMLVAEASAGAFKVMAAHDSWRAMLKRHDFELPTDDEIFEVIKEMGLKPAIGSHLAALVRAANWR